MNRILLTGAGFTRNWGGWLGAEAFEFLLGCGLSESNVNRLWRHNGEGGFEAALAKAQDNYRKGKSEAELRELQAAVRRMFVEMQRGLEHATLIEGGINASAVFLMRFDAIFTLNQDLFLERHYLSTEASLLNPQKWDGCAIPGVPHSSELANPNARLLVPRDSASLKLDARIQPYIKLHGSVNWYDAENKDVMVIGGNKPAGIKEHPFLVWNSDRFTEFLNKPDTRLLTIGYGFRDEHINEGITKAIACGAKLFVIAPSGLDVLPVKKKWTNARDGIVGASRRPLRETLGRDHVERSKLDAFLSVTEIK